MNKEKWIYIQAEHPYEATCSLGITKESSFILNTPHAQWEDILEYKFLTDNPDNAELDAIIVTGVGVIINRKALERNLKQINKMLNQ